MTPFLNTQGIIPFKEKACRDFDIGFGACWEAALEHNEYDIKIV